MERMQGTNPRPACASCKHQRKKCTDKCILAPLFPVEKTQEFQAVHKLFGVSNVTKIVNSLPEQNRKEAVDSLIWEASCRQRDPTLGPYAEFRRILAENIRLYTENRQMYEELKLYKSQNQRLYHHVPPPQGLIGRNNTNAMNIGGGNINNNNLLNYFHENRREIENGNDVILLQQHSANFINSYYFTGQ